MNDQSCRWTRRRLSAYLADELPGREQDMIKIHLQDCQGCQDELAAWRELDAVLAGLPPEPAPAGLTEQIMASLPRSALSSDLSWQQFVGRFLGLLTMTVVILIGGCYLFLASQLGWEMAGWRLLWTVDARLQTLTEVIDVYQGWQESMESLWHRFTTLPTIITWNITGWWGKGLAFYTQGQWRLGMEILAAVTWLVISGWILARLCPANREQQES